MGDSEDAFAWLQLNLPRVIADFGTGAEVDLARWVSGGDSAGAAIAAWGTLRFWPPPRAFISLYGMSTCTDPYYLPPGRDPPRSKLRHSFDEVQAFCDERDPTKAEIYGIFKHEMPPNLLPQQLRAYWGMPDEWQPPATSQMRVDMMILEYARKLMSVIGGRRERFASEADWMRSLEPFDVVRQVHARRRFAPTFMMHGTNDRITPHYHTEHLEQALRAHGVPVRTIYPVGEDHDFDLGIGVSRELKSLFKADRQGPHDPEWGTYIVPLLDFVDSYVFGSIGGRPESKESKL